MKAIHVWMCTGLSVATLGCASSKDSTLQTSLEERVGLLERPSHISRERDATSFGVASESRTNTATDRSAISSGRTVGFGRRH